MPKPKTTAQPRRMSPGRPFTFRTRDRSVTQHHSRAYCTMRSGLVIPVQQKKKYTLETNELR